MRPLRLRRSYNVEDAAKNSLTGEPEKKKRKGRVLLTGEREEPSSPYAKQDFDSSEAPSRTAKSREDPRPYGIKKD